MAQAATGSHCSLKGKYRKTFSLTPPAPAGIVALTELAVNGSNCSLKGQSWKLSLSALFSCTSDKGARMAPAVNGSNCF